MGIVPEQPKLARVLFDEVHSEAWTIRPELAERMQPAHPARLLLRRCRRGARAAATSRSRPTPSGPLDPRDARRAPTCSSSPIPPTRRWEATTNAGAPRLSDRRARRDRGLRARRRRPDRARRDRAGRSTATTSTSSSPASGSRSRTAPSRTTSTTTRRRPGSWPTSATAPTASAGGGRPPRPRRRRPASTAPAPSPLAQRRARDRAHARRPPSPPQAPARRRHRARRRPRRGPRRLRPVRRRLHRRARPRDLWLNLVYWAAQPAFAGVAGRDRLAAPAPTRLGGAQGRGRGAAADPGARRLGRPVRRTTRGRLHRARRDDRGRRRRRLAPPLPPPGGLPRRLGADLRAWVDAGFAKPDFLRSLEAFRPERDRRDGIEHLVVFPMYKQNASRDTCFEALIVRVPWPDWVAELERSGYDNPKFVPVTFVDYTAGYDSECAVLFPETFADRGAAAQPLRRHLLRPRGRALPPRLRRGRRAPAAQPAARRRLPARPRRSCPRTPTSSGT